MARFLHHYHDNYILVSTKNTTDRQTRFFVIDMNFITTWFVPATRHHFASLQLRSSLFTILFLLIRHLGRQADRQTPFFRYWRNVITVLFRQYDTDDSGAIDEREFRELAKAVNNASPMFPGNFAKALHDFDA